MDDSTAERSQRELPQFLNIGDLTRLSFSAIKKRGEIDFVERKLEMEKKAIEEEKER
jgi:hypothetical protein